ncbi:MAG: alpha/beta hydrolase [Desulfatirhabdiaceae bacterium]
MIQRLSERGYRLVNVILTLAGLYAAYAGLLFFMQRSMIFPRGMIPVAAGLSLPKDIDRWTVKTEKETVEAWFVPAAENQSRSLCPAVIFAHGNAELIDFWVEPLNRFSQNGIHLLLVEYPGYGRSTGTPSEASISRSMTAAYDLLVRQNRVDASRIILLGRSIGGGAVCRLARIRPSAALILMSTFTSIRSFAVRYGLPPFLVRDPMDNLSLIQQYDHPVLILHGRQDEIIPFQHAQTLHSAARNSRLIPYDSGHNDCPPDWSVFWTDVLGFLKEHHIL